MVHPKDRNNTLCPHEYWEMGPTIFKTVGLVPKSSKTIARSQIKCASCEICFYHLGLESPDLSPPLKTCISVTSAIVPTTGNACLKQAAATPLKGKLLMPIIHGPALPVSIWTKMERKAVSTFRKERLCKSHGTLRESLPHRGILQFFRPFAVPKTIETAVKDFAPSRRVRTSIPCI